MGSKAILRVPCNTPIVRSFGLNKFVDFGLDEDFKFKSSGFRLCWKLLTGFCLKAGTQRKTNKRLSGEYLKNCQSPHFQKLIFPIIS